MTENEFLLQDRITKIKSVNEMYDLNKNAYISFSGGKDSTILSYLIDLALPNNKIPRVHSNTGIELRMVSEFVKKLSEKDERFVILKPSRNIKEILETYGYPFKSKMHAHNVALYQKSGMTYGLHQYVQTEQAEKKLYRMCPKILKYQFSQDFTLKISDKCCFYLKEKPMTDYAEKNKKSIFIDGIMREEGGRRTLSKCIVMKKDKIQSFHPMLVVNKDFEDWMIDKFNIDICDIYKPPYNFVRTGCKGCPFALNLQSELETLEKFFPSERKQCEYIWGPVYNEYRKIGYRLKSTNKKEDSEDIFLF